MFATCGDGSMNLHYKGSPTGKILCRICFMPLGNEMRLAVLQKSKAKIRTQGRSSWLRLYAIRVAPNLFVITGGAIKLTHRMEEREHTRVQLEKLEKVKRYLADQGLFDENDFELMEI